MGSISFFDQNLNYVIIMLVFMRYYVKYYILANVKLQYTLRASYMFSQLFILFSANISAALLRGYMTLNGGWIAPFNGYQYKAITARQSWSASRSLCQEEGGRSRSIWSSRCGD